MKTSTPLPIPFDLPLNYSQVVMEGLDRKILNGIAFSKFVLSVSSAIFRYTTQPTTPEYHHVAQQIVEKYPFLKCKAGEMKEDTVSNVPHL